MLHYQAGIRYKTLIHPTNFLYYEEAHMYSMIKKSEEIISSSENKVLPWLVVFSAASFFFYEFIQMNMFSSLDPDLMHDFSINATQLSRLASTYFYANLLFLFPAV